MPSAAAEERIAARIAEAREYLEISQNELAAMIGVELAEVQSIEAGGSQVSASMLADIARALGRGTDFFVSDLSVQAAAERTEFLARAAETLSEGDLGELQRFAVYLRSRSEGTAA
jgi:transcriptional regulator with XRE-family HTH domain